jgi:beta-1,4-mannooligosaccharide/beta-1,4-mannosyl-N-acetylglucosamine phosphorylase
MSTIGGNMKSGTIVGGITLPKIPWENRPSSQAGPMWRYSNNPVIPKDIIPVSNSVFNSAVVPYNGSYAGVFRCDDKARNMRIHSGTSEDGYKWELGHEPIEFIADDPEVLKSEYKYDPRVVWIEDRYYVTWCNGYHGPTIGVGYTYDFKKFHQLENAYLPFNRNGVLFPRKINGNYLMLSRPSDNGHTPFGDVFISESPDMCHWGKHRWLMKPIGGWQSTKVGAGPIPIETNDGWLLFYHGVLTSCNGYVYSMGAAILDIDKPWIIKYRTEPYILAPETMYERVGDVPNVLFPCAALVDNTTGRIALYYGGADTVTCLAFGYIDEVMDFVRKNSIKLK